MSADALVYSEAVGLAAITAGVAWRFSPAIGLIVFGCGVLVLTFFTLWVVGKRA